jgi:hypothetical protein
MKLKYIKNSPIPENDNTVSILLRTKLRQSKTKTPKPKREMMTSKLPATIRRPGAETKVGGSPLITIGFKAPPVLLLVGFNAG